MPLDQLTYEPDDEILSTLIRAYALLSGPEKWCGSRLSRGGRGPNGELCVAYTVKTAAGETQYGDWTAEGIAASSYLQNILFPENNEAAIAALVEWNDDPSTTFEDVKTLFARAIDQRRAELRERVA